MRNSSSDKGDLAWSCTHHDPSSFSRPELRAIKRHQTNLSKGRGVEAGFSEAAADWIAHHAQSWREERQRLMLAMQREEIARHKWIRSEQEARDLGTEAALEWVRLYAGPWRDWFEEEFGDVDELPALRCS